MINAITGRPGGGKTYEAVRNHLIPAIKEGRKVVTNIPLNIAHIKAVFPDIDTSLIEIREFGFHNYGTLRPFSTPEEYTRDEWRHPETNIGPLFVVDEAHLSLPRQGTPKAIVEYFTMHRHYGVDIILVTQHLRQMDKDILNLIDLVSTCAKNSFLGSNTTYNWKLRGGYRGEIVNSDDRRVYDPAYFPFYKSHTQSDKAVVEAQAKDVKPIWKHWTFKGALIMFVIFIVMAYKSCTSISAMQERTVNASKAKRPSAQETQQPVQSTPAAIASSSLIPPDSAGSLRHPYGNVEIVMTGFYQVTKREPNGKIQTEAKQMFSLRKGGLELTTIDNVNLIMAGYDVRILNDCLAELRYPDTGYKSWVMCDKNAPQPDNNVVGIAASSAKNTVKPSSS